MHLGHPHHAVHELKMSGERADIGIITLLLRNLEIEYGFLVRLNHAGTGEDARVALGFPVVLNPFVAHFQNGVYDLLAFVFALGLAGSTKDEVVGKVVRVLEDYLHLGPRLHAEGTHVVLHLRLHGRDGHLLVNLLETRRDGEGGEKLIPSAAKHSIGSKEEGSRGGQGSKQGLQASGSGRRQSR